MWKIYYIIRLFLRLLNVPFLDIKLVLGEKVNLFSATLGLV